MAECEDRNGHSGNGLRARAVPTTSAQQKRSKAEGPDSAVSKGNGGGSLDERLGHAFYGLVQARESTLKLVLEAASLSADELLWLGVPYVLFTIAWGIRWLMAIAVILQRAAYSDAGEILLGRTRWEVFLGCLIAVCTEGCFVECSLKLFFRRPRPWYFTKKVVYTLPGEEFSMPSGHALRASTLAFWLTQDPIGFSTLLGGEETASVTSYFASASAVSSTTMLFLVLWVVVAMVARVGKGKHYPSDVVVGALIGVGNGWLVTLSPPVVRFLVRMICMTAGSLTWAENYWLAHAAKHTGIPRRLWSIIFWLAFAHRWYLWFADARAFL